AEVDTGPSGLDPLAPAEDLALERARGLEVDAEQPVPVGPRARAAAARLDAEEVVEQRDHEVVVEVARAVLDDERHDRQALGVRVTEDLDVRALRPRGDGAADERLLALVDGRDRHRALELEDEPCADGLDDRGGAALLAVDDVAEVAVLLRVDVGHRAAARD